MTVRVGIWVFGLCRVFQGYGVSLFRGPGCVRGHLVFAGVRAAGWFLYVMRVGAPP